PGAGIEALVGRLATGAAVAWIVGMYLRDRGERLIGGGECEQPPARGQHVREARVLGHDRLSARQVAGVPLAEPPAPQPDVLSLGHGELRTGPPDECWIGA